MRKITMSLFSIVLGCQMVFGGINTNTNQSASWVRMLIRDASTDIDAVYYNPAGLTKLSDGFHVSLNNQYITQGKTVTNDYMYLNGGIPKDFEGEVKAPIFPGVYAAFKTGKFVISAGFNPVGGGGSADFADGLPSFEMPASDLVPSLSAYGIEDYSLKTNFAGTSVYYGIQAGLTYAINDMISVYVGGRYIIAKNTYEGKLEAIMVSGAGIDPIAPSLFMYGLAAQATAGATLATGAGTGMQPLIDGGAGGLTFAAAEGGGVIDALTRATLEGGLLSLGFDQASIDLMTLAVAQGSYFGAATTLTGQAATATQTGDYFDVLLTDQEVDVEQNGTGVTPIIGVNISPIDALNIGIKYEFATKLELKNSTAEDKVTGLPMGGLIGFDPLGAGRIYLFPDGAKTRGDLPALLTLGVSFDVGSKLSLYGGFHYYFDKSANYGKSLPNEDLIDANNWEAGLAIEYHLSDKFTLSAGYQLNKTGVSGAYQTDLSYSLNTSTFGGGAKYRLNDMLAINVGLSYSVYTDETVESTHDVGGQGLSFVDFTQSYAKNAMVIGLGLDLSF
jgi:long-chain fatty acid transport protein